MSTAERVNADVRAEIIATEGRRNRALIEADLVALDELFDDDLVHIHAPGVTHDKLQLLEHVATRQAYLDITRGALSIRLVGDVAIMTGPIINRLRTTEGGERTLSGVATQVLRLGADGRWRFCSFQMTPTGEPAWPALPSEQRDQTEAAGTTGEKLAQREEGTQR